MIDLPKKSPKRNLRQLWLSSESDEESLESMTENYTKKERRKKKKKMKL